MDKIPVDIKKLYGDDYVVYYDISYKCEPLNRREIEKPWCAELRGKNGMVYPYNSSDLVIYTDNKSLRRKLKSKLQILQYGDFEGAFRCPQDKFKTFVPFLELKKKRRPQATVPPKN